MIASRLMTRCGGDPGRICVWRPEALLSASIHTSAHLSMKEVHTRSESGALQPSTEAVSSINKYKFSLLTGCYVVATGLAFLRVHRQPYNQAIKVEQYETIFKGTTLATVLIGVALTGKGRQSRSKT